MRNLKNLTLTVEPSVGKWAAIEAARRGQSVSRFVSGLLQQAMSSPQTAHEAEEARSGEPLPAELRELFWEFDFPSMTWPADRDLVVAKILETGDWNACKWVRAKLGADALRRWVLAREGRGLDLRRLRFFEVVLGLPPDVVQAWAKALEEDPWSNRLTS